jgi:eukaryotic-like serine/threonine-protein kinase
MAVAPGARFGSYEVVSSLGVGGMGEVYQARDTKLGRDVALKIVRPELAGDPERVVSFRREALALAAMNHPHIATVHEFNETEGTAFLVMELVPGETLRDRLLTGSVPMIEALRIGRQVAEALEAAHDKGIIHRDLKPANIKITPEGAVKVLDFGLAKALIDDDARDGFSRSPTAAVSAGVILGTLPYMSPEQARGKPVDRRADIWSFGCVMFELMTHHRPFDGDTTSDVIAAVLEREPDWRLLPSKTPPAVDRVLRRCLRKDSRQRLRDIGDARMELEEALEGPAPAAPAISRHGRFGLFTQAIGWLALGLIAGGLLTWGLRRDAPPVQPAGHFLMSLPAGERFAGLDFPAVAMSPDGSLVAYVGTRGGRAQLFVRPLNRLESRALPGTSDAIAPFFSPDHRWVAFFAEGKLKKVPVDGGTPVTLCEAPIGFGGSWGPDGTIVFSPATGSGLSRVPAAGGPPTRVSQVNSEKGEFSHRWPEWLPDGKTVVFTIGSVGSWDDAQIVAQSVVSGRQTVLVRGGTNPRYLPSGHLTYAKGGTLLAVPFDAARLSVTGAAFPVIENVVQSFDGAAQVGTSPSGALVYVSGSFTSDKRRLIGVERSGAVAPLAAPADAYAAPRVSPDRQTLAVTIAGATEDIWTYDIARAALARVTFEGRSASPIWTPDGQRLTFSWHANGPGNLFWKMLVGGPQERLGTSDHLQLPGSWSGDGRRLAFVERHPTTGRDLWILNEDRAVRPFLASAYDETAPRFSPDGRLIAYVSNESGRNEVYVRVVADPSRKWQVSLGGGAEPVWDPGGQELFFRAGDRMMVTSPGLSSNPHFTGARTLFEGKFEKGTMDSANYDVMAAPQRFVMVEATDRESREDQLHLLVNWQPSTAPR